MGRSERQDDEGNAKTQRVLNKNVARERRTEESLTETISVRRLTHTKYLIIKASNGIYHPQFL